MSGAGRRPRPVRKFSIIRALGFVSRRNLAAMNRAERVRVEVGRCLFVMGVIARFVRRITLRVALGVQR